MTSAASAEHRQQHQQGELGQQRKPGDEAERGRAPPGRLRPVGVRRDDEAQIGERGRHVGVHYAAMGEHRRLERIERDGERRCARPEQVARIGEDEHAERYRQRDHPHPRPQGEGAEARRIGVPEARVKAPDALEDVGFAALRGRGRCRPHHDERQRPPHLGERRMLVVELKLAEQVIVARRDEDDLVVGDGLLGDGHRQIDRHDGEQQGGDQHGAMRTDDLGEGDTVCWRHAGSCRGAPCGRPRPCRDQGVHKGRPYRSIGTGRIWKIPNVVPAVIAEFQRVRKATGSVVE